MKTFVTASVVRSRQTSEVAAEIPSASEKLIKNLKKKQIKSREREKSFE